MANRVLALCRDARKLYARSAGAWVEFSPEAPLASPRQLGYYVVGMPERSLIIPNDTSGTPGSYAFYDGASATWSEESAPGSDPANPQAGWCTSGGDVFTINGTGTAIHYRSPEGVWSVFSPSCPGCSGQPASIVALSSTDVWVVGGVYLWHLEGGAWVNKFDDAKASCEGDYTRFNNVYAIGTSIYFAWNALYGGTGGVLKYSGAGWESSSWLTANFVNYIWGTQEDGMRALLIAPGTFDLIKKYSGSAWSSDWTAPEGGATHIVSSPYPGNQRLNGTSQSDIWACRSLEAVMLHGDSLGWGLEGAPDENVVDALGVQIDPFTPGVTGGRMAEVYSQ